MPFLMRQPALGQTLGCLLLLGVCHARPDSCRPKQGDTWNVGAHTFAMTPEGADSCDDLGPGCEEFTEVLDCGVCKLAEGGCTAQTGGWGGCSGILTGKGQYEEQQHPRIHSSVDPPGCFVQEGNGFVFNVLAPRHKDSKIVFDGHRRICASRPVTLDVPINVHVGHAYVPPW